VKPAEHALDRDRLGWIKGRRAPSRYAGAALELAATDAHDVLLLDVHMPELDGFGVAQAIRVREPIDTAELWVAIVRFVGPAKRAASS